MHTNIINWGCCNKTEQFITPGTRKEPPNRVTRPEIKYHAARLIPQLSQNEPPAAMMGLLGNMGCRRRRACGARAVAVGQSLRVSETEATTIFTFGLSPA